MFDGIFIRSPGSCPRVWDLAVLGGGGVQNFYFLNMVMWHIKLKGMSSRHGYTEKILSYDQTGDLGMGSKDQIPYISSRAWGFAMARHRMCSSYIFESSL